MDTMHLIPTSDPATESTVMDLPSDETLIAWFEEAGLHIEVAATCGDTSCPECVRRAPARAA